MNTNERTQLELIHAELKDIKEDVTELKSRLLSPDDGAIARANRNTSFRKEAEPILKQVPELIRFQKNIIKVLWIIVTAVVAMAVRMMSMHQ